MKKTEKHVKFELPYISKNTSEFYRSQFKKPSLLSEAKILPKINSKYPRILSIPSLQRKAQIDIRSATSYNPSLHIAKLPSSDTTRPKRTTAAIYPTTDKVNCYLTRSRRSAALPVKEVIKSCINYPRISYVDAPISRSTQTNLQLTNWHHAYFHTKTSPIDITRKFCSICPERCRNFVNNNRSMRLSVKNATDNEFDGHLNTQMEMLRSNIPWSKIHPVIRPNSAFSDSVTSRGSQLAWVC
ncbi:unnamed protein product [Onchocerca flexuosa]|uniref:Uncharacterized protein n=1 Tax=Onchocerca flexuosa TaxID=387005 RepID=A0A183H8B2_9BILA|nr:unnamed protein product [Onchocerca flexuosa]